MNDTMQHPYSQYGFQDRYVLVNADKGSVVWYENNDSAMRDKEAYGGSVIDTYTEDPDYTLQCITYARRRM